MRVVPRSRCETRVRVPRSPTAPESSAADPLVARLPERSELLKTPFMILCGPIILQANEHRSVMFMYKKLLIDVCRGTAVMLVSPTDGNDDEIANPFTQADGLQLMTSI
ncbi:sm-like protein lsm7, partial [Quercus suber]